MLAPPSPRNSVRCIQGFTPRQRPGTHGGRMNSSASLECADTKIAESTIRAGDLTVNLETRLVTVKGNPVRLTPKEYEILELLSLRKGTISTKEMFLNHLYGGINEP